MGKVHFSMHGGMLSALTALSKEKDKERFGKQHVDGRELLELTGAGDDNSILEEMSAKRHSLA